MAGETAEDRIDAVEILHDAEGVDLHFRYMGFARGRQFVLNIQFASEDVHTKDRLRTEEHDFMIGKILGLVLDRMAANPNPGLH